MFPQHGVAIMSSIFVHCAMCNVFSQPVTPLKALHMSHLDAMSTCVCICVHICQMLHPSMLPRVSSTA